MTSQKPFGLPANATGTFIPQNDAVLVDADFGAPDPGRFGENHGIRMRCLLHLDQGRPDPGAGRMIRRRNKDQRLGFIGASVGGLGKDVVPARRSCAADKQRIAHENSLLSECISTPAA